MGVRQAGDRRLKNGVLRIMPIVRRLICEFVEAHGAIVVALLSIHCAAAAELPLLPGIGHVDHRVAVDPTQPPWNAVAKVQTNIGTRCTGALIAPDIVLTAAHCLYNRRTQSLLQAGSLHVLFGYSRGDYRWHRAVSGYTTGSGFEGRDAGLQRSDWALLELADPIPGEIAPLSLMAQPLLPDAEIMLAGSIRTGRRS